MRRALTIGLGLAAAACHEPDLTPVRQELATSAAAICAPAPARAPHAAKTRAVAGVELEGAIVKLCLEWPGTDPASDGFATIHEGLAEDRAILGALRRSRLVIDATRGAAPDEEPGVSCGPSWMNLGRAMVDSAKALAQATRHADALARCADVVALTRDDHLAGNLTDAVIAETTLELAAKGCRDVVDGAPQKEAALFASTLAELRASFPPTLGALAQRDHDEMLLLKFAPLRDRTAPYACARAEDLANVSGAAPLKRSEKVELLRAWDESRRQTPIAPSYGTAYARALGALDDLIAHAKTRAAR